MSDRSVILNKIRKELVASDFFKRNSCTCRIQDGKVIVLKKNGCDLNVRLGGRANQRQMDVHLFDKKVHDQKVFNFDWSLGLTDMQIREIVDYCEELVPKWQGETKSGSSRHVGIKCEGRSAPLRQRKEDVDWRRTKKMNGQALPQTIELINDLDELILNHNPWSALSEKLKRRVGQSWDTGFSFAADARFALDDDVEKIKEYNDKILRKIEKTSDAKKRKEYEKLLLKVNEQQPIPFIGHPESKVWVLAMNPYYNPLEWCTFIKWDDYEARIKKQPGAKARPELRNCFEERQKLYAKSLNFSNEKDKRFYILDGSMHVFEGDGKKKDSNKDWSGYLWYRRRYFPSDERNAFFKYKEGDKANRMVVASKHFFALEFLPYPSKKFDGICKYGDLLKSPHVDFWRKFVKYALYNDKILIVRGRIMDEVRKVDPARFKMCCENGHVLGFKNKRCVFVSRGNVLDEHGVLNEYVERECRSCNHNNEMTI